MSEQSLMHVICIQSQIPPKYYVNYLKQNQSYFMRNPHFNFKSKLFQYLF